VAWVCLRLLRAAALLIATWLGRAPKPISNHRGAASGARPCVNFVRVVNGGRGAPSRAAVPAWEGGRFAGRGGDAMTSLSNGLTMDVPALDQPGHRGTRRKMATCTDISGQRFGRLTALRRVASNARAVWECRCDCGVIRSVDGSRLRAGRVKSCGCKGQAGKTSGNSPPPPAP
jgi:hypothetical protein